MTILIQIFPKYCLTFVTGLFWLFFAFIFVSFPYSTQAAEPFPKARPDHLILQDKKPFPKPRKQSLPFPVKRVESLTALSQRPQASLLPLLDAVTADQLNQAMLALESGKDDRFQQARQIISDPLQRDLLLWLAALGGKVTLRSDEIGAFLERHPDWPRQADVISRYEDRLIYEAQSDKNARKKLLERGSTLLSDDALFALALILRDERQNDQAYSLASELWRSHKLNADLASRLLGNFGHLLTKKDDEDRYAFLLAEQDDEGLKQLAVRLDDEMKADYDRLNNPAALQAFYETRGISALSPYHLLRLINHLREESADKAADLMIQAESEGHPAMAKPGYSWRILRLRLMYSLVDAQHYDQVVRLAEATYLNTCDEPSLSYAGRIALNEMQDPERSERLFARIIELCEEDDEKATALFWQGEAQAQAGRKEDAVLFYERALLFPLTFYGQLAADRLKRDVNFFPGEADLAENLRQRFSGTSLLKDSRLKAGTWLFQLKRDYLSVTFFLRMILDSATQEGSEAIIAYTGALGDDYARFATASLAASRKQVGERHLYRTDTIPAPSQDQMVERAVQLAVARKESNFNPHVESRAGALGLMQLLPRTAESLGRTLDRKVSRQRLMRDKTLNVTLGSRYLYNLQQRFGGSIAMALAAYNAGPTRLNEWINTYGDPRDKATDWLLWLENLPYRETRTYIKTVIADITVYRWMLGKQKPLRPGIVDFFNLSLSQNR